MKKLLLKLFAGFLTIGALAILTIYYLAYSTFKEQSETVWPDPSLILRVELNPEWKDEGKRLTQVKGCLDCHGDKLQGKTFINDKGLGTFAGSNLTPHANGVGENYTDSDWVRAIRFGKNRERKLLKFMPSEEYFHLSDEDLGKIIVYLKSLPPHDNKPDKIRVGPLAKVMNYFSQMPLLFSGLHISEKDLPAEKVIAEDSIAYGKYLSASCIGCHNPQFTGGPIEGVPPSWPHAADITSNGKMRDYTLDDFKKVLTQGVTKDGRKIDPQFMPWTATAAMSDTELSALYKYLKSL